MNFFKKNPPAACPKCGKSDGWRCVLSDATQSVESSATAVNPFSSAPIRNTFGQNLTGMKGQSKKLRYRCDNCGYEKTF
ncbi:MAG: hypothetical protein IKM86_01125 [Acidaminococcaceae bacterium]|nr:hypothetical protein [Acidaminococcaceae bacterium]